MSDKDVVDLTKLKIYTIDDSNTFEIDDGISLECINDQNFIWVHISNPSDIIPINSDIDKNSNLKGSSIYLSNQIIYMLPKDIVEHVLSLKAGKLVPAVSIRVKLDLEGNILDSNAYNNALESTNSPLEVFIKNDDRNYLFLLPRYLSIASKCWTLFSSSTTLLVSSSIGHQNKSRHYPEKVC